MSGLFVPELTDLDAFLKQGRLPMRTHIHCKHFANPFVNERCSAGVRYSTVSSVSKGDSYNMSNRVLALRRLPCVVKIDELDEPCCCEHREMPSDEELRHKEEESAMYVRAITSLCILAAKKLPDGGETTAPCPHCPGVVSLFRSPRNGHVWGRCSSANCLNWTQ